MSFLGSYIFLLKNYSFSARSACESPHKRHSFLFIKCYTKKLKVE